LGSSPDLSHQESTRRSGRTKRFDLTHHVLTPRWSAIRKLTGSFRVRRNPFLHRALSHGYRLEPYEVRSRVGANGVGEVHGTKILFEKSVAKDASR